MMQRFGRALTLCAAVLCLFCTPLIAQDSTKIHSVDTLHQKSPIKVSFEFDASAESRNGYIEYEIDVGWVPVQPEGDYRKAGSRLRFPIDSRLAKLRSRIEFAGVRLGGAASFQIGSTDGLFKDYDWFELNGKQNSFIFGSARNIGDVKQYDIEASYTFSVKRFRFCPQAQASFIKMSFDAEDATQWQYYAIDSLLGLVPLDEVYVFDTTALVITYDIDYKAIYVGGAIAYCFPFGLDAEFRGMYAPLVWADDVDIHLLRHPPKRSEVSSDGDAALLGLKLSFHASRRVEIFGGIDYSYFKTSGRQKQTDLGEPYEIYVGIPATTKSEWHSISGGVRVYFGG